MELADKIITVTYMSVNSFPAETTVKVVISQEIQEGIFRTIDTYDLKFEQIFQSPDDAALLAAINEKLTSIV